MDVPKMNQGLHPRVPGSVPLSPTEPTAAIDLRILQALPHTAGDSMFTFVCRQGLVTAIKNKMINNAAVFLTSISVYNSIGGIIENKVWMGEIKVNACAARSAWGDWVRRSPPSSSQNSLRSTPYSVTLSAWTTVKITAEVTSVSSIQWRLPGSDRIALPSPKLDSWYRPGF